jgi:imidazolonepropionase-like amidohydrolase
MKNAKTRLTFIVSGVIVATLHLTACTPVQAPVSTSDQAITGVAVVDVEKGIVLPDQTVIIADGLIRAVGPRAGLSVPKRANVIDGRGLYLIPGLVDAHVHYLEAPVFGRVMIANGVLLVRDMGMPNDYILKLRDELNRGETLGPEMVATGTILDGDPPLIPSISMGIKTPEVGRAAVRQQAAAGVDMIKVYNLLDKDVFLAIVDEAQKIGLKVAGDLPESVYIEDAAMAGMQSSEHYHGFEKVIARLLGEPVTLHYAGVASQTSYLLRLGEVDPRALQDFYQRLRASGMTVDPTIVTAKNWPNADAFDPKSLPGGEYISQNLLSIWKKQWAGQTEFPDLVWQNWAQMVEEMNKAGVPLMVGTDLMVPGIFPGYSVHEEMAIWQEAGIPAADVLRSATIVPAQFMGLGDRLGGISEGKTASMVLVRANPLEDIKNAQQIEGVFLRGHYFSRDNLDRLLAEAKELAQQPAP